MFARRVRRRMPLCVFLLSLSCVAYSGLAYSNVAYAQQGEAPSGGPPSGDPRGGPPTAAQELQRLAQALTLTDEQKSAILPILEDRHAQIDALMKSGTDRTTGREQMRTIMDASNVRIRAVLTEAQQKIFESLRPPKPPSGGGPGGSSDSGGPPSGSPPQV